MALLNANQREAVRQRVSDMAMGRAPNIPLASLAFTPAEFNAMTTLHGKAGVAAMIAGIDAVLDSTAGNVGGSNVLTALANGIPAATRAEMPNDIKLRIIALVILARAQMGVF